MVDAAIISGVALGIGALARGGFGTLQHLQQRTDLQGIREALDLYQLQPAHRRLQMLRRFHDLYGLQVREQSEGHAPLQVESVRLLFALRRSRVPASSLLSAPFGHTLRLVPPAGQRPSGRLSQPKDQWLTDH